MNVIKVYETAFQAHGSLNWWPGETVLEIAIGAILTQNTSWHNVTLAINALKDKKLLNAAKLLAMPEEDLALLIRPSGYYRQKSRKLKAFLSWWEKYYFDIDHLPQNIPILRDELLSIWGIGPETADSILLYALNKPIFVVDRYTFRIAQRHSWWDIGEALVYNDKTYNMIQKAVTTGYKKSKQTKKPSETAFYNDFHAHLVYIGNHFCHKRKANCLNCPWHQYLND